MVLNVIFLKRTEETAASEAGVLKLLPEGHGAQARLGEGLAHGPAGLRCPVPVGPPAAADVVELLDALVNQRRRGLLVSHCHAAAEEHLELLGKRVVELRGAAQLLLAGNLPRLADGADDLRHLREKESVNQDLSGGHHVDTQGTNTCSPHKGHRTSHCRSTVQREKNTTSQRRDGSGIH